MCVFIDKHKVEYQQKAKGPYKAHSRVYNRSLWAQKQKQLI